jgi:hypothetical protein
VAVTWGDSPLGVHGWKVNTRVSLGGVEVMLCRELGGAAAVDVGECYSAADAESVAGGAASAVWMWWGSSVE